MYIRQHKSPLVMSYLFPDEFCVCPDRPMLLMVAAVDYVNCQTGVALPTGFPGQVSG